jgi:molybdate transport system ATP-binding protein
MLAVRLRKELHGHASGQTAPRRGGGGVSNSEAQNSSEPGGGFTLDVEFSAPAGVTIIFGASGSGKSLTLRALAGLLRPDSGHVRVGDLTLFDSAHGINLPARERRVGYVFQNLALFPHLTARENVEFALPRAPRATKRARALELLERFRVAHAAERLPRNISGGEAQRVALARAHASGPRLLLLDEPLSALDEETKLSIISDLKRHNRELRLPILYVTHSRDEALALGERAIIYERGRVAATGLPADVFDAPVKASLARLVGVENVFEGVVSARDEAAGTMLLSVGRQAEGGCRVEAPLGPQAIGERVSLAIRSGDILLATTEPQGISARNVLRGRVAGVERRESESLVRVTTGGVVWATSVTHGSVREMELEEGKEVWLLFKTYACRVLDAT